MLLHYTAYDLRYFNVVRYLMAIIRYLECGNTVLLNQMNGSRLIYSHISKQYITEFYQLQHIKIMLKFLRLWTHYNFAKCFVNTFIITTFSQLHLRMFDFISPELKYFTNFTWYFLLSCDIIILLQSLSYPASSICWLSYR